jgi:hypothetical protein
MPNIDEEFQPGRNEDDAAEDEAAADLLRRKAERHGGFDDEGRPVKPSPVEPEVSEEESKLAEESGEMGFAVDTSFGADDEFIGTPLTATAAFTNAPGASIAITATQ